ncbi:MAG: cbb3-type cytochrome c oxidase subunit II [Verrucomicrobiota bacterium]
MKNGPLFFLGLLIAIAISWGGLVLGSHAQLSSLAPYFDDTQGQSYPARMNGIAARGQLVYADLGCAACHTQQARRGDFGSDKARGWGDRQSVARDYIYQPRPQLGASRFGPDLATYGARVEKNADATTQVYNFLYTGSATHPSYKFLFEQVEKTNAFQCKFQSFFMPITGQPSAKALKLSGIPAGEQVVPTERAQSLAAYLLSLSHSFQYPEAAPYVPAAGAKH